MVVACKNKLTFYACANLSDHVHITYVWTALLPNGLPYWNKSQMVKHIEFFLVIYKPLGLLWSVSHWLKLRILVLLDHGPVPNISNAAPALRMTAAVEMCATIWTGPRRNSLVIFNFNQFLLVLFTAWYLGIGFKDSFFQKTCEKCKI